MTSNYDRFMMLYGNNKRTETCNGSKLLGESYVCPKPTIGGRGKSPFPKQNPKCGAMTQNMGRLAYCAKQQLKEQKGGSYDPTPNNLIFNATGQITKKNCYNSKTKCTDSQSCHRAARKLSNKNLYPPDIRKHQPDTDMNDMNYSGNSEELDYPRDQCGCRSSSHCGYMNGQGSALSGFFIDPTSSIGNRPLHGAHDNIHINSPQSWNNNLMDRKFGCQQPYWCEKCL